MKAEGIKPGETKATPAVEKPKTEKSAFDKLMRNKAADTLESDPLAGAMPAPVATPTLQFAPVMKKDETPGPASVRLLDNLSSEITTTLNTKDIKEVSIQFDSRTLAGLQVSVRSEQGKLLVKMEASNADVAHLLERNSTGLVERLAEKGYAGAEVRVDRSASKIGTGSVVRSQPSAPRAQSLANPKRGPR